MIAGLDPVLPVELRKLAYRCAMLYPAFVSELSSEANRAIDLRDVGVIVFEKHQRFQTFRRQAACGSAGSHASPAGGACAMPAAPVLYSAVCFQLRLADDSERTFPSWPRPQFRLRRKTKSVFSKN
jgi:hypothetical protein